MFFNDQPPNKKLEYEKFLKVVGGLSNLFSDSKIPYLYYRVAEKIFCRAFNAQDLSRSDVSVDAKKDDIGIELKTFLAGNNKSFQKVAEFNSDKPKYEKMTPEEMIKTVAISRNARIQFTENNYKLKKSLYHCVVRDKGRFKIFETPIDRVDIDSIKVIKDDNNSIRFNDGQNDYSFLKSKSTLTKRFITDPVLYEFDVDILEDPLFELHKLFYGENLLSEVEKGIENKIKETIYLPLYGRDKIVFERSGLNQWNAEGRARHPNEVYIPIPVDIHKNHPLFFPHRDTPFSLILPNGETMKSKVCQDNSKALMSFSNKKLGKWILRDVLNLAENQLLTYEKLEILGIDSVRIDKIGELEFEINFAKNGSYENFKLTFKKN